MDKKRWELEYEKYESGEKQGRYEELRRKVDQKIADAQEYKEFDKMSKVMRNLPKVKNIMEYREKLEENLEMLKEEYNKYETQFGNAEEIVQLNRVRKNLDEEARKNLAKQEKVLAERKKITKRIYEIDNKLREDNSGLSEAEIAKLKQEKQTLNGNKEQLDGRIAQLRSSAIRNSDRYFQNVEDQNRIKNGEDIKWRQELAKYSRQELREKCFKAASMISKCNFIAGKMMEGQNRDSLEIALKDWKDRKFTSKTPLPMTRKEKDAMREDEGLDNSEGNRVQESEEQPEENNVQGQDREGDQTVQDGIVPVNQFEQRFPRLSKFLPKFFKNSRLAQKIANMMNKNKDEEIENQTETPEVEEQAEQPEEVVEEPERVETENKREKFRDYLKYDKDILDVADKGINAMQREEQLKKYIKLKEEAYKREEAKYGKDYAEKSYHMKNDDNGAR